MPYKVGDNIVYNIGERGSGLKVRSLDGVQDFKKIRDKCIKSKCKFEDDDFSANDSSLGKVDGGPYTWRRPNEICHGQHHRKPPQFIVGEADRFDIQQGDLGNCWLLAAMADLTLNKDNFKMVVPDDNFFGRDYTGAFHFRFWQFGRWIDVVIDDRLPCGSDGQLAFIRSHSPNEFWSPLLEKAYAKLNGSYQALDGGFTFEALEDFTGGFTEVFLFSRLKSMNLVKDPEEFYDLVKSSFDKLSFMGSSVKAHPEIKEDKLSNGLICGHAYSITGVRVVNIIHGNDPGPERLLRIRNPWGNADEWVGDWSDNSPTWKLISEDERTDMQVTFTADGEFWMSYHDFVENFERIEVCHLNFFTKSELLGLKIKTKESIEWTRHSHFGSWTHGVTAGGSYKNIDTFAINPQYLLDIGEPGVKHNTLIVCLLKKVRNEEEESAAKYEDVENVYFNIFPVDKDSPKPLDTNFFKNNSNKPLRQLPPLTGIREITIRYSVPSGLYVIIPSSITPNQEGEFLLRVNTEGRSDVKLYDHDVQIQDDDVEIKDDSPEDKLKLVKAQGFFNLVAGKDKEVNWWDLKLILDKSFHDEFQYEGFGFSEDVCRSMVALMDADRSGKLGFFEFTNLWTQIQASKKLFSKFDINVSFTLGSLKTQELRSALNAGGYTVNKDTLESIVLRYGDRNGEVALDKFIIAALKLKTMIETYKRHEIKEEKHAVITMEEWLDDTLYS